MKFIETQVLPRLSEKSTVLGLVTGIAGLLLHVLSPHTADVVATVISSGASLGLIVIRECHKPTDHPAASL